MDVPCFCELERRLVDVWVGKYGSVSLTARHECIKRTARRVRVRIVQLERDALDEVAQVVRAADDVRVRRRGGAAHSDGPAVRVGRAL